MSLDRAPDDWANGICDWLYRTAKDGDELSVKIFPGARQVAVFNKTRGLKFISRKLDLEDHEVVAPRLESELVSGSRYRAIKDEEATLAQPGPQTFRCDFCGQRQLSPFCPKCWKLI